MTSDIAVLIAPVAFDVLILVILIAQVVLDAMVILVDTPGLIALVPLVVVAAQVISGIGILIVFGLSRF